MTEELYGYVTLGVWLTMVLVAAAGLWPRKRAGESSNPAPATISRRQRAVATTVPSDDGP